ncbi:MAG: pentapeptide repeat-containing protein [Microbacterium sp.]
MARTEERPAAPRVSAPDMPPRLDEHPGLQSRAEHFQQRIVDLEEQTDAAHADVSECRIAPASVSSVDLTGAALVDVEVEELRATTVSARDARLRRVRIRGGRIGTLDLADAELDEVELRGIRIDYLSLATAHVQDLLVADCVLGTLDLPQTIASRVRFENTSADDVDTRALRADDVDLRGLDAVSFTDAASLRGTTLTSVQIERLAPAFAATLGIHVKE